MGWLNGWSYRKSHVVNSANGAGTNYQVRVKVNYGSGTDSGENVYLAGKCRTDFGDVRFTDDDGSTLLDYWMETKVDGSYAIFWVEVADDLSSSNATIYVYYGNSDASTTSNGENTFLFFDDFPGSSYDPDKWQVVGSPTITVSNGELKIQRSSFSGSWSVHGLRSKTFQADEKRLIVKMKFSDYLSTAAVRVDSDYYSVGQTNKIAQYFWGSANKIYASCDRRDVGGSITDVELISGGQTNTYYVFYTTRWSANYYKAWVNGDYKGQVTSNVNDGSAYIGAFIEEWGTHATISGTYDWIAVAKYVDPEPSHGSWGNEEQASSTLKQWSQIGYATHTFTRPYRSLKLTQTLNASHVFLRHKTFKLTQNINLTHYLRTDKLFKFTQTLKTLSSWTLPIPSTLKQWVAMLETSHVFRRPLRSFKLAQTLNVSHVFRRPFRFFKLTQNVNLAHVSRVNKLVKFLTQILKPLHNWVKRALGGFPFKIAVKERQPINIHVEERQLVNVTVEEREPIKIVVEERTE